MIFQNRIALFFAIFFLVNNNILLSETVANSKAASGQAPAPAHVKYIKLKSDVLHSIDGMPNCIDADAVKNIVQVLQAVKSMLFGDKPKHDASASIEKSGNYKFKDKNCCLMELGEIEKIAKTSNNTADLNELNKVYLQVKNDFLKLTEPFIGDISVPAIKNFMTKLIDESCHERKRFDSYLLSWSRQNGTEIETLNRDLKDIQAFSIFCSDLCNFLGDLLHSCPKGVAKYKAKYILQTASSGAA